MMITENTLHVLSLKQSSRSDTSNEVAYTFLLKKNQISYISLNWK